jgi:DNA damage-binding protein 1
MDESLYIVTAINGASVVNSFYDESLVVVYNSAVEFHKITNCLELESRISLNAKVSCAKYFESQLLILTQKCELLILKNKSCIGTLDLKEESGRMTEFGHIMIVDPTNSFIACHIYQGLIRIIPVESLTANKDVSDARKGKRKVTSNRSPFNVRLKELLVLDMIFLYTMDEPCLVILHQDALENLHIVSYKIDFENHALVKSDLIQEMTLDEGISKLIPLMGDLKKNVLAISQTGFTLITQSEKKVVHKNNQSRIISAWEWMDSNTLITVDHNGSLDEIKFLDSKCHLKSMGTVG